jgi:hypothetical protein
MAKIYLLKHEDDILLATSTKKMAYQLVADRYESTIKEAKRIVNDIYDLERIDFYNV